MDCESDLPRSGYEPTFRRDWLRRLLYLLLALLGGVIATVASAWMFSHRQDFSHSDIYIVRNSANPERFAIAARAPGSLLILEAPGRFTASRHLHSHIPVRATSILLQGSRLLHGNKRIDDDDFIASSEHINGFPCLCMSWYGDMMGGSRDGLVRELADAAFVGPGIATFRHAQWEIAYAAGAYPLRILPIGFALNSLFYGTLIYILLLAISRYVPRRKTR